MPRHKTRGNGQGTAYKRGNVWEAQVIIGWKLSDKPDAPPFPIKRRKSGFKTKAAAIAYCNELRKGIDAKPKDAPRLSDYWDIYEAGELEKLSKSKQTAYRIAWNKLSDIHLHRVDALNVQDLRTIVSEKCKTYYPAKDCKNLLSALFKLAAADGYASKDLPSFIILPALEEKEREAFSENEQAALWRLYESGDLRAAIPLFMIYTGAMPGETMKIKVENIDLDHQLITGAGLKTKVRKQTPIVIADTIVPLVRDLIDHAMPTGYLWPQNEDGWYEKYYGALESAGCRKLTPYSCRHTTATALAINENIAPQTIRKIMRWSTSKMLDRYAHPQAEDALEAVNAIGKK